MTVACWITSIRFILAPLIYWQIFLKTNTGLIWAIILLGMAGLSDLLDGWAARSRNEVSELGKVLDPLTDKMVIFSMMLGLYQSWELPFWLLLVYFIKELMQITAGAYLLKKFKQLIPANHWGKSSTFGFFLGFALFFIYRSWGIFLLAIAFVVSVYAFYTYYLDYQVLKEKSSLT